MMEPRLREQLGPLEAMLSGARLRRGLAWCWLVTAAVSLVLFGIHHFTGWDMRKLFSLTLGGGFLVAARLWLRERRRVVDFRAVAMAIERAHPHVRHMVTTALEQEPNPDSGEFGFLQWRVIEQVLTHPYQEAWEESFRKKFNAAARRQMLALGCLLVSLGFIGKVARENVAVSPAETPLTQEVTVTPGDTQVERGTGLVVTARFGTIPADASLVVVSAAGTTKRLPMARQLADPVFGAGLPTVTEEGLYRVEYGTNRTREYKIGVFDYPALTRADVSLEYPSYTSLTNQTIRDTLRVSAVEGTRLTYTLQLNKSVASARLIGPAILTLEVQTNAVARLDHFALTNSARYRLELVDADGRTNKFPEEFSLVALRDRPPEVKVIFPRGDQRVSLLEELELEGSAKGEFGLQKYGVGYSVAGADPRFIELGRAVPPNMKCQFTNQIAMENLGVSEDQVVSYFAWADDHGPDGRVRRTFSDMFFAEIRPFEEVFRADQSGGSESQNQNQSGGGNQGGNQSTRLAELQKQIVIATWKLQQEKEGAPSAGNP